MINRIFLIRMAVKKCCILNCNSSSARKEDVGVTYHKFPKNPVIYQKWLNITSKNLEVSEPWYVCSRHFRKFDFQNYMDSKYILKPVPEVTKQQRLLRKWASKIGDRESKGPIMSCNNEASEDALSVPLGDSVNNSVTEQDAKATEDSTGPVSYQKKDRDMKVKEEFSSLHDMGNDDFHDENIMKPSTSSCFMDVTMTDSQSIDKSQRKQEWKNDQNILVVDGKGDTEGNNSLALSVGSRVEAKDFAEMWYPARIVELDYDEMEVLVHYDNSSKKYDEWINVNSPRLRPWTSDAEPVIKEEVYKENDSEQITKEKGRKQSKQEKNIEPINHNKDESEEKLDDKLILRFKVGERCLARWKDNRRFLATVVKELDNGKYEIIFDDGFPWTCSVSRLVKVKPHTDVSHVSSSPFEKSEPSPNLSHLNVSSGGEHTGTSSPVPNVPAASVPYHKHLFDPTRDYLGPKSERRELKRKLNIKDLFNIGTTKRRRTRVIDEPKKKQLELKVMLEKKRKRKRRRGPVKTTPQKLEFLDVTKIEQEDETISKVDSRNIIPSKVDDIFPSNEDKFPSNEDKFPSNEDKFPSNEDKFQCNENKFPSNKDKFPSNKDKFPSHKDTSVKATEGNEDKEEDDLRDLPNVCMEIKSVKKVESKIDVENKSLQEIEPEGTNHVFITLEDIKNVEIKPKEIVDNVEERIVRLEDCLKKSEVEENLDDKIDTKKEDGSQEKISYENKNKLASNKNWKLKQSRLKKARKLRLLCEKRVKKEVEEVKNQLVEMKRQVEEMKKQVKMKSVEALSENNKQEMSETKDKSEDNEERNTKKQPETRELLPGEWCCKWVNGHPQGIVSEVDCDIKIDGISKPALPRRSVQVEDNRLPPGWTKHLVRRSFGSSAGQWNVVLVSPENKRFHTKAEVKTFMQVKKNESLKEYERGLFDFGVHRRLSRKIGWDIMTCRLPATPLPSKVVSASSPILSKKVTAKPKGRGRRRKLETPDKGTSLMEKRSKRFDTESTTKKASESGMSKLEMETLSSGPFSNHTLIPEDGYVYVGSLKVQLIENLLRCPAEGCFKNFRNTTLLQMHIKHYHRELRKSMGATPKVLDLAYARALPLETEKSKSKPETEHKTTRLRMSKPKKLENDPNIETIGVKAETTVESTPPPLVVEPEKKVSRTLDSSPKLRNALVGQPTKRPKVLLPVRKIEKTDETEAQSPKPDSVEDFCESDDKTVGGTEDEEDIKSNTEYTTQLDFELEISSHTVTKPVVEREKKKRVKALLPVLKVKPMSTVTSEEDEWYTSDLETRSSYPRSGTPDSRLEKSVDTPPQPTSSECNEEVEDEKSYITETGERIKIVHMKREEIINCHCGFREEDGLMIQCELCLCWQHALCHNIQRESEVPEKYTCSICLNPRRGRRSQRFMHDQDRLYEGLLPGARPDPALRRAHELSGNLLRFTDALHALKVKYYVATKKNHPKLYLWAKDWENGEMNNSSDMKLNNDYLHLSNVITDIGKENLPIQTEDLKNIPLMDTRAPSLEEDGTRREGQLVTQLTSLLSSPSGPSLDIPISATELEHLAKSVQECAQVVGISAPTGPQPEAAIEDGACRERLLRHVQRCQALIDARLDSIEAQVAELESQDPSFEDDETADYFPRTKQTIQMLLRDLDNMEELGFIS